MNAESGGKPPLVSIILATRDRPRFLSVALSCCRDQTYTERELIVIDDGEHYPADEQAVAAAGGLLLKVPPGTPLGAKLNFGIERAKGDFCQKMDDDDWYGPHFLEEMISKLVSTRTEVCRPTIACMSPFLFFDIARWELHKVVSSIAGSTLLFAREDWEHRSFREVRRDEDTWFVFDQTREGLRMLLVRNFAAFVAIRHRGSTRERKHTWTHLYNGQPLEDYLKDRPLFDRSPEEIMPERVLAVYRELRQELMASPS